MIDWARISELRDEIGAEDFEEVVALFLSEVEERLETLCDEKSLQDLEEELHFLKGSALNLGFEQLASICHSGEKCAGAGQSVGNLETIQSVYEASKVEFFAKLEGNQAA
ncbi:MAG: Hpt domain-containing protein [Planktotalea sp.]|uniref:Hpt domain-containing protein n=1 Tax=Planktotalea sp. TaxID=2029877 RepID=UPI003C782270